MHVQKILFLYKSTNSETFKKTSSENFSNISYIYARSKNFFCTNLYKSVQIQKKLLLRILPILPEDVWIEIMGYVDTVALSRMIRISKEMGEFVHAFLRLNYQRTFEIFMRAIISTRAPNRRLLLRYSAPKEMTSKLKHFKYVCYQCGKMTVDIASCAACTSQSDLIKQRLGF